MLSCVIPGRSRMTLGVFLAKTIFDTEQEARKNVDLCLSQLREAFGSVMPYDLSKVPVQEGFDG